MTPYITPNPSGTGCVVVVGGGGAITLQMEVSTPPLSDVGKHTGSTSWSIFASGCVKTSEFSFSATSSICCGGFDGGGEGGGGARTDPRTPSKPVPADAAFFCSSKSRSRASMAACLTRRRSFGRIDRSRASASFSVAARIWPNNADRALEETAASDRKPSTAETSAA